MKRKRIISFLLALTVCYAPAASLTELFGVNTGLSANVYASETEDDNTDNTDDTEDSATSEAQNTYANDITAASEGTYVEDSSFGEPDTSHSKSALLMDMDSGRLIYGNNIDVKMYPASTTKMMTCILALEMGNMSDMVTANYQALASITLEDSQMGILIGEEFTLEQLIYGMMVQSANDAANVIAIHIAGSIDAFVELMNNKAQELGMTNTHFANACGIHDDNHYTTARDLSTLARYAMQNETFRDIVKTVIYKIPPTPKYKVERTLVNTNLFLSSIRSSYHVYPPCTGIKTGHTSQSGYCLVASANYNDTNLLAVSMGCEKASDDDEGAYSYIDTLNMFQYGFDNYLHQVISTPGDMVADQTVFEAKNNLRVALTVDNEVSALIPLNALESSEVQTNVSIPEVVNAPISKGDVIGTVTYTYKGAQIGAANLVATNDVELNYVLHIFHIIVKIIKNPFFFIPVILILIIAIAAYRRKKKMERKRRIQQLRRNRQNADNELNQRTPDRNASRTERQNNESKGANSRYGEKNRDR